MLKRLLLSFAVVVGLSGVSRAAFPVILVDTTNVAASDFNTSGAGPTTAIVGSTWSTSATGLVVTVNGSPNLSSVATDGSAALFLQDNTLGHRNFARITATAGSLTSTASVTVSEAFAINMSSTAIWAIGGIRATIGSTTTVKLFTNNGGAGDLSGGWIVQAQSGHSETIAATYNLTATGDATNGPIILRGAPGAVTRPLFLFSNNGAGFNVASGKNGIQILDIEMQNTNATKTASTAITDQNGNNHGILIRNVKISNSTNKFWRGVNFANVAVIEDCEIGYCASHGAILSTAYMINSWVHDCGGTGILVSGNSAGVIIDGNIIALNAVDGIQDARTVTATLVAPLVIQNNTLDTNTGSGINLACTSAQINNELTTIESNQITSNTVYGINFSGAGMTDALLNYMAVRIRNNNIWNNTSNQFSLTNTVNFNTTNLNPQYVNTAGSNYAIGPNTKAKGYPLPGTLTIGTTSNTSSYSDPGAAQRREPTLISVSFQ